MLLECVASLSQGALEGRLAFFGERRCVAPATGSVTPQQNKVKSCSQEGHFDTGRLGGESLITKLGKEHIGNVSPRLIISTAVSIVVRKYRIQSTLIATAGTQEDGKRVRFWSIVGYVIREKIRRAGRGTVIGSRLIGA